MEVGVIFVQRVVVETVNKFHYSHPDVLLWQLFIRLLFPLEHIISLLPKNISSKRIPIHHEQCINNLFLNLLVLQEMNQILILEALEVNVKQGQHLEQHFFLNLNEAVHTNLTSLYVFVLVLLLVTFLRKSLGCISGEGWQKLIILINGVDNVVDGIRWFISPHKELHNLLLKCLDFAPSIHRQFIQLCSICQAILLKLKGIECCLFHVKLWR